MVYVIQQPAKDKDLSSAADFGPINYIFGADERPDIGVEMATRHVEHIIKNFDPDSDFLLWPSVGNPVAMAVVMAAVARLGIPYVNFLVWNKRMEVRQDSEGRSYKEAAFATSREGGRVSIGMYTPVKIGMR